ncbi:MAG: ubiquinol-cytochrome c reductase iron-sulfur subunit [Chloroflexi bacterium]|nr:ubiquinol-cytochrome c reductase iron-sulfur subunit [Chloroflexota bacterium]
MEKTDFFPDLISERPIARREFFKYAWLGLSGLFLAQMAGFSVANLWPVVKAGSFGGQFAAGKVEDFPVDSITHVKAGKFYISHLEEGFLAIYQKCTHLGCTVPWVAAEDRFNCPCHQSIFNKKGEVLSGPAPRALDLFPIKIVNGGLIVDTGTATERQAFNPSQVTKV